MPWFKVDDKLHDHDKTHAAGKSAMGVWVLAGSWAADNLTDGHVPRRVLGRWGNHRDATALVNAGLWTETSDGWLFNDWCDYQPTRAHVEEVRAKRAENGRAGGKASGQARRKQT